MTAKEILVCCAIPALVGMAVLAITENFLIALLVTVGATLLAEQLWRRR